VDIIPKWIYDPDRNKVEDLDPQRSWDRDPDIKPVPSDEDAFAAARYKRQFGDPNIRAIDIGDPYARQTAGDFYHRYYNSTGPELPLPKEPITPKETDYLRKGQLMTSQMPATYGLYEPNKTSISRGPGESDLAAGLTQPYTGEVWAESNRNEPNTLAHEYGHAAYIDLYNNVPAARDLMHRMQDKFITPDDLRPENGFTLHELLTRANLERHFGPDVEGPVLRAPPPKPEPGVRISYGGGPGQYQIQRAYEVSQNPEFKVMMRQLDKMAAHRSAQRLIERQGGVYQQGGPVRPNPVGPDLDATEYWNTHLPPDEEARFQQWATQNDRLRDLYDYDMRGAWQEGLQPGPDGHWPDTYKKPNHPTFSNESMYHGSEGNLGGRWDADETGSETLQPYDRRFDPRADELDDAEYRRQIGRGNLQSQVEGLDAEIQQVGQLRRRINPDDPNSPERQGGLSESEKIRQAQFRDPAEAFRHPTYEQLAADPDLRRGRTRMAPRMQAGGPVQQGGLVKRRWPRYIEPHLHEFKTDPTYPLQGEDDDEREPPPPGPSAGSQGGTLSMEEDDDNYYMPVDREPDPSSIEGQVLKGERQSAREQLDYEEEAPDEDEQQRRHGKSARESYQELGEADRMRQKLKGYRQGGAVHFDKISAQMDDPEHGSWHDDGKFQIYTPRPSFFAEVNPHHLVDYFEQHAPEDHRLHLP
jgi:hypothetical protein